jgi:NADPH-dependent 2,4-dienoyl-CoA reductase/sulfur reductase-like enzyme/nitrite reductase/ring-hydroxylating ferredoxin subunit
MTTKNKWHKTVAEDELKEGAPLAARIGTRSVFLTRVEGRICAMGGKCSHYGGHLEKGRLQDHVITCPLHTARFDVRSGQVQAPPALDDLARYETKVEAGDIYVRKVPAEALSVSRGDDDRTFLILGAGAGGLNAALALRRIGFAGRLLMATAEADLPYDRPDLSKGFMAGGTPRDQLALEPEPVYLRLAIEILKEHRATGLDRGTKTVVFSNRRELRYDRLLLATGGTPRIPDIKGTRLSGFFVLRSLRDADGITGALSGAKAVAVIGGSFLGLEVAASLRSRGLEVHVVAPEPVLMARVFGAEIGAFIRRRHEKSGIVFHLERTVTEISGNRNVSGVVLSDGSRIAAQVVIAGIGVVPVTGYLETSGLLVKGVVPVDARFQTADPDIFAVGDIALLPDPLTGEARRVEHWVEAERQGRHAASGLMGISEDYRETPFFWTNQGEVSIKYAGYASSFDRIVFRGDLEAERVLIGYYRGEALRAVAAMGRTKEFLAALQIIKSGAGIPPSLFEDPRVDLAEIASGLSS